MNKRISYLDYAKAFAIILICIGHFLPSGNFLKVILYSFHVPLFFFISGYIFNSYANNFKTFILKKAKRILIPYFLFFFLSSLYYFITPDITITQWIRYFFFIDGQTIWNAPLWFLPVIFITSVLFFLFESNAKKHKNLKISVLSLCCFLFTMLFVYFEIDVNIFGINKVIHMLGYMGIGYLVRRFSDFVCSKHLKHPNQLLVSVYSLIVFTAFCITALKINHGDNISVLTCDYNNIFTYIPLAIIGSVSFIFMFFALKNNRVIQIVSSNTLFIMSTHYIPLLVFKRFYTSVFLYCFTAGMFSAIVLIVFCMIWNSICKKYKLVRLSKSAECLGLFTEKQPKLDDKITHLEA